MDRCQVQIWVSALEIAHSAIREALRDRVDEETRRTRLERVFDRLRVMRCAKGCISQPDPAFCRLCLVSGLTFLGDSNFFPKIVSRGERYEACCDNELLHAGSESGIKDAGRTGDSRLKRVVFPEVKS
jgi:hypothetical protein